MAPPAQPWTLLVQADDLKQRLDEADDTASPPLVMLDCRHDLADPQAGRAAYESGHVPRAIHAHLDRDLAGPIQPGSGRHPLPDPGTFRATMGRFGIGPETQVVAYDDLGGAFAARAWWLLRYYGHRAVAVLDGGIRAWTEAGGTLEEGPHEHPEAMFVGNPGHLPIIEAAGILRHGALEPGALIDARAPERYRGDTEPLDPKAGHIPGAVNHPFSNNLGPDGRFLAPASLRARFQETLADTKPDHAACYCGSGVTAAHNLLAMEIAGLGGAALYPGSWSEWCQDDDRPVAQGSRPAVA